MGYESRIYVVEKSDIHNEEDFVWAEVIAMFNLCCVDNFVMSKILEYGKETDCFIVVNDKDTHVDAYGKPILELALTDMINILDDATDRSDYRRYLPLLKLLRGFDRTEWNNLVVLHYGY